MSRTIPWRAPVACAALIAATIGLGLPDRPTLPVGEVTSPVLTAFLIDGLRLLVTVSVWYLLLAMALTALERLPGLRRLTGPVADRIVAVGIAGAMRRVLATSAALGVSLPAAAGAQGSDGADPADEVPVMIPVPATGREADAGDRSTPAEGQQPVDEPPIMTRQDDAPAPDPPPPEPLRPDPSPTPDPPRAPAIGARTHTVRPGESFWSIAVAIRQRDDADPPPLEAVAATWQRLLDANADNLIDPGNPDLLHVGQVIDLA